MAIQRARSRLAVVLAASLAGGTLLSTCQGRLKDGIVQGAEAYFFSLLDPTNVADFFVEPDESTEDSSESP